MLKYSVTGLHSSIGRVLDSRLLLAHPVFGSYLSPWAWFVNSHLVNLIENLTEMIIPSQINSPLKEDLRLQMKLLNLVKLFVEPHL